MPDPRPHVKTRELPHKTPRSVLVFLALASDPPPGRGFEFVTPPLTEAIGSNVPHAELCLESFWRVTRPASRESVVQRGRMLSGHDTRALPGMRCHDA